MKTKTKKAAPSKPGPTTVTAEPCIFTPADRRRLKKLLAKESFDKLMTLRRGDRMPDPLIADNGSEIDRGSMNEISINWWHDDGYEYIYQIGKSVYAYYDDRSDFFVYEEGHVTSVIESSYPREDGYWEEKCVQFEVKPPLSSAKRGDDGLCRVWINTFFREIHKSSDSSQWAREENGQIIEFESYSAARKWINQDRKEHYGFADIRYPKGHYLYRHNEYAPREYKICK